MIDGTQDCPLDAGIRREVEVLVSGGIETFESCQGGVGHPCPEPMVRFHGGRFEGYKALQVALSAGLQVSELRRIWPVIDGEPTGPWWEMTFTQKSELADECRSQQELKDKSQEMAAEKETDGQGGGGSDSPQENCQKSSTQEENVSVVTPGMTSERPLRVGDWVVAIDPNPKWPMAENMNKPMRVVDIARRFGWDCLVLEGQKENPWVPYKFRRVDPQRDEVAATITASAAPIYWRFIGSGTKEQERGFSDYKLDGGVMFMSIVDEFTNVVSWDVVHLSISELDADPKLERCNPEGTPLAEVSMPQVECDEVAELREQLADAKHQLDGYKQKYNAALRFVDEAFQGDGKNEPILPEYVEFGGNKFEAVPRLARDYAELKQQLAEVTRERDRLLEDRDHVCALFGIDEREHGWIVQYPGADDKLLGTFTDAMDAVSGDAIDCEQERDTLREQLATVQRVLVESLNLTEVGNEFAPACVDVDNAMCLASAAEVAIDTLKLSAEKHKLDAEEANKALAAVQAELKQQREENHKVWNNLNLPCIVEPIAKDPNGIDCTLNRSYQAYLLLRGLPQLQAEAAAMRCALHYRENNGKHSVYSYIKQHTSEFKAFGNTSDVITWATNLLDRLDKATSGTAGRELLDELRRKDERVRELEAKLDQAIAGWNGDIRKFTRHVFKCRKAKRAYVATLRGKIDPAWFGENVPVWQYRTDGRNVVWRTIDGGDVEKKHKDDNVWCESCDYRTWQACCDDPATYPCDENGKRIEEQMTQSADAKCSLDYEKCWIHKATREQLIEVLKNNERYQERVDAKCIEGHDRQVGRIADLERQLAEHKRDAELCRELRAFLLDQMEVIKGCVVTYKWLGSDTLTAKLNDLLVAVRDGGAK